MRDARAWFEPQVHFSVKHFDHHLYDSLIVAATFKSSPSPELISTIGPDMRELLEGDRV